MFRLLTQKLPNLDIRCIKSISNKYSSKAETIALPEYADVVIIGGGSAGCNALYHLGKRGVKAVLLEKSKLSSGTTWHTAGLVWCLRGPSDVEVELLKITRRVLTSLEEETGANSGYINNGGIYIAHTMARMGEYKRLVTASKAFGLDTRLISPKEAKDLFPLLDDNSFQGAVHSPADGTVDPAMLLHALKLSAKNNKCEVFENCPVTKIITVEKETNSKKISAVQTPHGTIKTNCVLNAAGAWSNDIAKLVGLDIPLVAMKHAYIVTDHIQEIYGHPNVRAPDLNLYFKIQGGAMSIGGYEYNPIILKSVPMDFAFSLYEMDWNVFDTHMKSMVQMMPRLSKTGIKTTVCGPESFTPDHRPIMGEDPRCTGLFYSCGYNSAGMMLGGGCGEQIAQWIVNGRPDLHMFNYDIRRYIPEQRTNSVWINERTHEAYDKNYNTVFRYDQPLAGRNLKVDPFHEMLLKEGAFMEESQGWERVGWFLPDKKIVRLAPYDYSGAYGFKKNEKDEYRSILEREYSFDFSYNHDVIKEEALSCRENVAMFNLSNWGKFYLCGEESKLQEAIDYIFTSSPKLDSNKMMNTYALNNKGGVEAYCTVTPLNPGSSSVIDPIFKGKALYIVVDGASSYQTWVHIHDVLKKKNFQVTLHDVTEQIGILSVQGPQSIKILQMLLEKDCSDKTPLDFSTARLMSIQGELVRVCRTSTVGEFGFELHIPKESCEKMYKLVMDYGKQFNMKLAGFRAMSSLACEKGYPEWNTDLRIDDNPLEAGLDVPCDNNDMRYLGKEAVERCKKNGVKRKRVHVHVKDKVPIWGLETIYRNQELVGYLRRTEYSYYFDKSIGQGYIHHPSGECITEEFLKSGNYEVGIMGDKYPAELYAQSPFDPQDKRLLGIYN